MTRVRPGLQWSDGAAGPVLAALASDEPRNWMDLGACQEVDGDVFYPEKGDSNRAAKKVCSGCFVRSQCLEYALATNQQWGIWGGVSARQRWHMSRAAAA